MDFGDKGFTTPSSGSPDGLPRSGTNDQLKDLLDLAPDALIVVDGRGTIRETSRHLEVISGYSRERLIGQPIEMLVPELLRTSHEAYRGAYLRHPSRRPMGTQLDPYLRTRTGAELPIEVSLSPFEGTSGRLVIAAVRDVSERRRADLALRASRARLSEVQRIAGIGSWSWDVVTDVVTWSAELYHIYGLDPQSGPGSFAAYLERVHPGDRDRVHDAIYATVQSLEPYEHDYRIVQPGGEIRITHARGEVTARDGERPLQLMGYCHDVTAERATDERRRHAQTTLASHERMLQRIARGDPLEETLDLICAEIEMSNPGTQCSVLTVDAERGCLRLVASPSLPPSFCAQIDGLPIAEGSAACGTAAARNEVVIVEDIALDPLMAAFVAVANEHHLRSVWSQPLGDAAGDVVGTLDIYRSTPHRPDSRERSGVAAAVSLAALATERAQIQERLSEAARLDPLTNLHNRAAFVAELRAQLTDTCDTVAVMFVDLDGFKWINDSLGHPAGDRILREVARRLKSAVGEGTTLARFGGDEFAFIVANATQSTVEDAARQVEVAMSPPFVHEGGEFFLSASIGSSFARPGATPDGMIQDADAAMYAAKVGGSRHASFTAGLREDALRRVTLEAELRRAIDRDEFVMYYQPVADLATGSWAGAEALVRWQHSTRGLLAPAHFVPLAEETGLIVPLGIRILECVAKMAAQVIETMPDRKIGINISARQLSDPTFSNEVMATLGRHRLSATSLLIEITETALMKEGNAAHRTLQTLADTGMSLVIDDFGRGYSSITRLRSFPVTGLKIDEAFCADLGSGNNGDDVVKSIIDLAHALHLSVVIEGIETAQAATAAGILGADFGQGYQLALPVPEHELMALLASPPRL